MNNTIDAKKHLLAHINEILHNAGRCDDDFVNRCEKIENSSPKIIVYRKEENDDLKCGHCGYGDENSCFLFVIDNKYYWLNCVEPCLTYSMSERSDIYESDSFENMYNMKMTKADRDIYLRSIQNYSLSVKDLYIKYIPHDIVKRYINIYLCLSKYIIRDVVLEILKYISIKDIKVIFQLENISKF